MSDDALQDVLDRAAAVSGQRWALSGIAVAAATTASVVSSAAGATTSPMVALLVAVVAVAATVRPDSHIALTASALVLAQWGFGVDDETTALAIPAALALALFHCVVALLAVTPPTITLDGAVLTRWGRRFVVVAAGACWTWLTVVVLAARESPGNTVVTAIALVTLAALLVTARSRADT